MSLTGATEDQNGETSAWAAGIRKLVDDLVTCLDSRFDLLTSRNEAGLIGRQLAAGGLARCRSALRGMALLEADCPDLIGLLNRNLWEIAQVALFVLLGGREALSEVFDDYAKHEKVIVDRNVFIGASIGAWPAGKKLNIEHVARRVTALLDGSDNDSHSTVGYDLLYRGESTFGGHGGGTLAAYTRVGRPMSVCVRPGPLTVEHPASYLALGGLNTILLASRVFDEFGVSTEPLRVLDGAIFEKTQNKPGPQTPG